MVQPNPESEAPDKRITRFPREVAVKSPRLQSELNRQSRIDLSGVRVRIADSDADFQLVAEIRRAGFGRVVNTSVQTMWLDVLDDSLGTFSLLGYTADGQPVATMRVQDGRLCRLELEQYVPLHELVGQNELPATQFARLSVLKSPASPAVMYGLFKAAWRWALQENIRSLLLTTPPWSKHLYEAMCFDSLGPRGEFIHSYAGGVLHATMRLPVEDAEKIWRATLSPLCTQMFDVQHPKLELEL